MRSSLAAFFLTLALAAPAAALVDLFPRPNEIFPLLLADPRHMELSASYYRLDGNNQSDIALGHAWGMGRWRSGPNQEWLWEWDLEGMAYSRFRITRGVNEFQTVDFLLNLPITVRRGDVSFKGMVFHQSSHLGDDYIRRTGDLGYRYSVEGLRGQAALDPCRFARLYAGGEFLLHTIPSPKRMAGQAGVEAHTQELHWSKKVAYSLFLAQDFQSHERVQWNVDSHTLAGIRLQSHEAPARAMRLQFGYFTGHSPFAEFYARKTHYADVSLALEL